MRAIRSLRYLERGQVGDELVDLSLGQAEVGHAASAGRAPSASARSGRAATPRGRCRLRHSTGVPRRVPGGGDVAVRSVIRSDRLAPANVARVMRWVRLGPRPRRAATSAFGSLTPLIAWHGAHWPPNDLEPGRRRPAVGGLGAGFCWFSTHGRSRRGAARRPSMRMLAWERPQYSVHWPQNTPGSSASS